MSDGDPRHMLGNEDLGRSNHICGLFQGPAEGRTALMPFVIDGLREGERVVYFAEDPADVRRALTAGRRATDLDVSALERSGAFDLRGWGDSYLANDRFAAERMLELLRTVLREGETSSPRRIRLVGEMQWATDELPGVEELIAYEAAIGAVVRDQPSVLICAYDVRRHSASRIAAVAAVHESVFVGGRLQRSSRIAGVAGPRGRILESAGRLFGNVGVRAAGVDALIAESGVAKATFYRYFRSKDELIVAWLDDPRTRWFERVLDQAEERAASPGEVAPRFFEVLAGWLEAGDYRGCPYLNTAIELRDPSHPAMAIIQRFLREVADGLSRVAAAAGAREPDRVGSELQALAAGSISLGVAHRSSAFLLAASRTAADILRDAGGTAGPRRPS